MAFSENFEGGSFNDTLDQLSGWTLDVEGSNLFRIATGNAALAQRSGGGGSGRTVYLCTDQASGDHETSVDFLTSTSTTYSCVVRYVDVDNFVSGQYGGTGSTGYRLHQVIGNTETPLIQLQGTSAPFTMKVTAVGEDYELFQDGGQIGATIPITDDVLSTSATRQGMIQIAASSGGTPWFDNFLAAAIGGGASTFQPAWAINSNVVIQ